jgi:hypothetical protein
MRVVLAAVLSVLALAACEAKEAQVGKSQRGVHQITTCIHGVEYFVMWNSNAFDSLYPTTPVIDPETLKPRRCNGL